MSKVQDKWLENPGGITPIDETPAGTVDGVNAVFTLSQAPKGSSHIQVFLNGLKDTDYTLNIPAKTVTFNTAPALGQQVRAYYFV